MISFFSFAWLHHSSLCYLSFSLHLETLFQSKHVHFIIFSTSANHIYILYALLIISFLLSCFRKEEKKNQQPKNL